MAYVYDKYKDGRPDRVWWMGLTDRDGVPRQQATTFKIGDSDAKRKTSEKKAQAYADAKEAYEKSVRDGVVRAAKPPIPFDVAARRYLGEHARQFESADSIEARFEKHWIPALRSRPIATVLASDITTILLERMKPITLWRMTTGHERRWFASAAEANEVAARSGSTAEEITCKALKPQSRRHLLNSLQAFYRWAICDAKLMDGENPCSTVKVKVPKRRPTPLRPEWLYAIIQCFPDEDRGLVATAAMTGARAGELRHARVGDVDLERQTITVTGSNQRDIPKDNEERVIRFPKELIPYLRVELGRARSAWLFPARNGKQRRKDEKLAKKLRAAMIKAGIIEGYDHRCRACSDVERRADDALSACPTCGGIRTVVPIPPPYTFKDLRSTWATIAGRQMSDSRVVQAQLGHADPRTTLRYEDVDEARLDEAKGVRILPAEGPSADEAPEEAPQAAYPALTGTDGRPLQPVAVATEVGDTEGVFAPSATAPGAESLGLEGRCSIRLSYGRVVPPSSTVSHPLASARFSSADPGATAEAGSPGVASVHSLSPQPTYPALTGPLLTPAEYAQRAGFEVDTIYGWIRSGRLPAMRLGNCYRIRPDAQLATAKPAELRGATAANAAKTHCPSGHELDGRRADGHRYCKTCNRERGLRRDRSQR